MPELPEVQALVTDLGSRLGGRIVERLEVLSFAVLKTYEPPVSALHGMTVNAVTRHGKFLDLSLVGGKEHRTALVKALDQSRRDSCSTMVQGST